jgi:hypothetical protein
MTMSDHVFDTIFLHFLFGVLMPKGEKNIYLSFSSSFLFGFVLYDFNLVRVGRVDMCFKTLWYACKAT